MVNSTGGLAKGKVAYLYGGETTYNMQNADTAKAV